MKTQILAELRQMLLDSVDKKFQATGDRVFKEEIKMYGVKVPVAGRIGKDVFQKIKKLPKQEIFELCEELWQSGWIEEGHIACNWSYALHKQYEPADFKTFERWVRTYITNWATCDSLCNHTVGTFVEMYPEYVGELKKWTHSDNRWMKRAAAVTLIIPAREGLFLGDILEIADTLLLDSDDLVRKGYGWMLKAASLSEPTAAANRLDQETRKKHLEAVFDFVMKRRAVMPRTALRYAIEKMPPELKAEAMMKK